MYTFDRWTGAPPLAAEVLGVETGTAVFLVATGAAVLAIALPLLTAWVRRRKQEQGRD